jgi:hypothetical protein
MPEAEIQKKVPDFEKFKELATQDQLFETYEYALEWLDEYGPTVLKDAGMEIVKNLLTANSIERRTRGQISLERAIKAQVAWLEMFQIWAKAGKFPQLKKLTDAVRDPELSNEEHSLACMLLLDDHVDLVIKTEEDSIKREEALFKIHEHLKEEPFMNWVEENQKLLDTRPTAKDPEWAIKALAKVMQGMGESVPPNTLSAVAANLDYWSKIFFGEAKTAKPKSSSTRSSTKAKAKERGRENHARIMSNPEVKRGYVQEGGRKKR